MLQELIAYLIIAIAFGILIRHVLRFFNLVGKKTADSSSCGRCSTVCEMKELHMVERNKSIKPTSTNSIYNLFSELIDSSGLTESKTKLPATNISAPES